MSVTKTQLRDFIDKKISERKRSLYKEIKEIATASLRKELSTLLGDLSELSKVADRFGDLLEEKILLLGERNVPSYAAVTANHANRLSKPLEYFLDEIVDDAMRSLTGRHGNRFSCAPLEDAFNRLYVDLLPKTNLYQTDIDVLKNELHNAISNASTGKKAYEALVALGVDMSDLPELNPNLPAVIKLSVDPCVINGNCKEEAEA